MTASKAFRDGIRRVNRAPAVVLLEPAGGEPLTGSVTLRWESADPDGDPLTVRILLDQEPGSAGAPPLARDTRWFAAGGGPYPELNQVSMAQDLAKSVAKELS